MEENTNNTQEAPINDIKNEASQEVISVSDEQNPKSAKKSSKKLLIIILIVLFFFVLMGTVCIYLFTLTSKNGYDIIIMPTKTTVVTEAPTDTPIVTTTVAPSPVVTTPAVSIIDDSVLMGKIKTITTSKIEFAEWVFVNPDNQEYKEYCANHTCIDEGDYGIDIPRNKDYDLQLSSSVVIKLLRHPDNDCGFEPVMSLKEIALSEFVNDECGQYSGEYTSFFKMHIVNNKVTEITEQYRP